MAWFGGGKKKKPKTKGNAGELSLVPKTDIGMDAKITLATLLKQLPNPKERNAAWLMASGRTSKIQVAERVGVDVKTIHNWQQKAEFKALFEYYQYNDAAMQDREWFIRQMLDEAMMSQGHTRVAFFRLYAEANQFVGAKAEIKPVSSGGAEAIMGMEDGEAMEAIKEEFGPILVELMKVKAGEGK